MQRRLPKTLVESWDRLPGDPPLKALVASHTLHGALASWQTELVREALASGASWEEMGQALGTTKQGAWARFRVQLEGKGGHGMVDSTGRRQARQRARELWEAGQTRLGEIEARWREEQEGLRRQVRETKERLSEARQRHARERRDARQELRKELEKVRAS
jgi:hypothetical protein